MSRLFFYIFLISFSVSCSTSTSERQGVASIPETLSIPIDSPTYYFPIDSTDSLRGQERFLEFSINSWYSKMLYALREPVLFQYTGEEEIYRFTWLRTFDHPAAIRIQKQDNNIRLFAKVTNGAGGYDPGQIIIDTAIMVSEKQWNEFKALVERADFWNLPTTQNEENGTDGSQWIMEGVHNRQYHWVDRWSPVYDERYVDFTKACEHLLKLSKVPTHANGGYY